jgi:hypothetical protein
LIVFPSSKIQDNNHHYIVEFEIRVSRTGKKYGIAKSEEIYHPFVVTKEENKTKLDIKKFDTHYTITLSNITIKTEECKICHLKREKEIPTSETADIVVSDVGDKVIYSPYKEDNITAAYSIIKYLNENNIKLEPNIRYNRVEIGTESILIPNDIDTSLKVEEIKEIPSDINAYSYHTRKFVNVIEEEKKYKNGDDEYIDVVRYYINGGEKRVVSVVTYRIAYEYEPVFYSSFEDDDPESSAKVERLVERKTFENVVNVNATFINLHREKAIIFKALYKALTNAGYKITITRSNDNKKIRIERNGEYGEISRYSEFATGYYAELARQIYNLTF